MEKCGTTTQNWFLAIEKGDLSLVQKLWKDINDIDVTDNYILNNTKVFCIYFNLCGSMKM